MTSLPVKSGNGRWLNPCPAARARQLLRAGKAVMRSDTEGQRFLQLKVPVGALGSSVGGAK